MARDAIESAVIGGALTGRPAGVPKMKRKIPSELRFLQGEHKRRTSEKIADDQLFASAPFDSSPDSSTQHEKMKEKLCSLHPCPTCCALQEERADAGLATSRGWSGDGGCSGTNRAGNKHSSSSLSPTKRIIWALCYYRLSESSASASQETEHNLLGLFIGFGTNKS